MAGEETICFYGYPEGSGDGARLDEFTRQEVEDITRHACRIDGKPFDQEVFDEYWSGAQERKRAIFAARPN